MGSLRLKLVMAAVSVHASGALAQSSPPSSQSPAASPAASAQALRYRHRLLGVFDQDSGEPIAGIEVRDVLSGMSATTTATGTVSLLFLPDGGSLVRLRKLGYEMQTFMVAISPADTTPLTILLHKAVQLSTVQVHDSASGFLSSRLRDAVARMRNHAGGYFIDEASMRANDDKSLALTMLPRMPGMMSTEGPHGETFMVSSRQPCKSLGSCKKPNCFVGLVVDGVPAGQADFSRLSTIDYAMAEFYPGPASVPVQFPTSPCGVLLLWSRER